MEYRTHCALLSAGLLAAALAGGCSITSHKRVEGWPELTIVEHYVSQQQMRDRCAGFGGPGRTTHACAEINFKEARCDIWLSADSWLGRSALDHERRHCQGYDHAGGREMEERLARYRASQRGS